MGSQGILRRSNAGWGVIRGKRMVPNESELDSANCRGRAGGETASAGGNSGGCWRSLGPKARPTDGTARVESWIVGSVGVFGVGTFEGDMG